MATTTQKSGLTFKHKVGYAMGDLGGCMTFALMGAMVTRYYTNVLQVNTAVLATLLLVWNIWDAVNDPMMGALMDKMYAKHHNKTPAASSSILPSSDNFTNPTSFYC